MPPKRNEPPKLIVRCEQCDKSLTAKTRWDHRVIVENMNRGGSKLVFCDLGCCKEWMMKNA